MPTVNGYSVMARPATEVSGIEEPRRTKSQNRSAPLSVKTRTTTCPRFSSNARTSPTQLACESTRGIYQRRSSSPHILPGACRNGRGFVGPIADLDQALEDDDAEPLQAAEWDAITSAPLRP